MPTSDQPSKYVFMYSFTDTFKLPNVKLPDGITLFRKENELVNAVEITVRGNEIQAKESADGIIKRLVALISLFSNKAISAKRENYYTIMSNGSKHIFVEVTDSILITDSVSVSGGQTSELPQIDLTKAFNVTTEAALRQLKHFQKGNSSSDPIERYREFFLVLEEDKKADFSETALRHAVNHPYLEVERYATEVMRILGTRCFDPTDSKQCEILSQYANGLRQKALLLLSNKFMVNT